MLYDSIQGQGHGGPKLAEMANFKVCLLVMVNCDTVRQYLNFHVVRFLIFVLVRHHMTFKLGVFHLPQTNIASYESTPVQGLFISYNMLLLLNGKFP